MGEVAIEEATSVSDELMVAIGHLVPQLSRTSPVPSRSEVAEIVASPATVLLLARTEGAVVGSLTLVLFRIPTGVRAWVEDVVVDQSARGRGIGEALGREALRRAVAAGARTVDLTSRPSRQAANRMYRRLGFEQRETNVYRWSGGT
ncbi:MAG: GNAT family N-acetyltransferase [Actinomycetota bacterium]|nr:GNAT family N-acetyltransferase [Actinomycetota bacterium]